MATNHAPPAVGPAGVRTSTQLLQEAKKLKASLKTLLTDTNARPGSSEVEFARRNLRNTLLNLLFGHPFTRDSHGIDVFLWIETTHPLVSSYRAHISELKKVLAAGNAAGINGGLNKVARKQKAVEYSKTLSDFRKFLEAEEIFWQELASRVTRAFGLDEARASLKALDIPCEEDVFSDGGARMSGNDGAFDRSARPTPGSMTIDPQSVKQMALRPSNRQRLIEIVHKALICCGDLARYQEMYAETVPQPDAESQDSGSRAQSRNPRNGKKGSSVSPAGRQGNKGRSSTAQYSRAVTCYEQARSLLPHNGNPSNQIAVIAMYNHDYFGAVYHYYRALCVRVPFETARQNLENTFRKALDAWRKDQPDTAGRSMLAAGQGKRARAAQVWLRDFVALHAMFFLRKSSISFSEMMKISGQVHTSFATLLKERTLQTDQIVHVVVIALSASWTARLWRSSSAQKHAQADEGKANSKLDRHLRLSVELQILSHALVLFQILAEVGRTECDEAVQAARNATTPSINQEQVASNITAVFRRMMPALRIATKWVKSHLDYIHRSVEKAASSDTSLQEALQSVSLSETENVSLHERSSADQTVIDNVSAFWRSYADFINTLRFAFPYEILPSISDNTLGAPSLCLEEDLDMRGFTPVKKAMIPFSEGGMGDACGLIKSSDAHPNEEQLMRISDLLVDAKVIAESDASPIVYDDAQNAFLFPEASSSRNEVHGQDNASEIASESTDDILDLAMQAVDQRTEDAALSPLSDDEEDEQILIPQHMESSRATFQPPPIQQESSISSSTSRPQNAQDLLLQMLNGPSSTSISPPTREPNSGRHDPQLAPVPQSHMLFGGMGSSQHLAQGGSSIWSSGPGEAHRTTPRPGDAPWRREETPPSSARLPPPGHPAAMAFQEAFAGTDAPYAAPSAKSMDTTKSFFQSG